MLHYANIFIDPGSQDMSPEDFAQRIFGVLGIAKFEGSWDRDGNRCFVGRAAGIEFNISAGTPLAKFSFWLSFGLDESPQAADYLIEHARVLAWRFARAGWRCFIPKGEAQRVNNETEGVVYAA